MDTFCWSSMAFFSMAWSCCGSPPVIAYVGPGAGLSAIGALLAIVLAVVVAVLGFVWYPIKRLMRRMRTARHGVDLDEGSKA